MIHHRSSPSSEPKIGWLAENIQRATKRVSHRGVERAGAPGAVQSCPTLPLPRRLVVVLPSCGNKWNSTQRIYNRASIHPVPSPKSLFHTIISYFHSRFYFFPTRQVSHIFPVRPCSDKAQQNGRKNGRKKKIK